jgi:hypothetical protein
LLSHRDQMDAELVQARLLIKLNHYPDETTCEERLCHLDRVDWEGRKHFLTVLRHVSRAQAKLSSDMRLRTQLVLRALNDPIPFQDCVFTR